MSENMRIMNMYLHSVIRSAGQTGTSVTATSLRCCQRRLPRRNGRESDSCDSLSAGSSDIPPAGCP